MTCHSKNVFTQCQQCNSVFVHERGGEVDCSTTFYYYCYEVECCFFYLFCIWPDTHTPKHMMMPQQQPKKSWEGGAGRSVGCCYAGSLLFSQVGRTDKWWHARGLLMLLFLNKQQCCFVWQVAELRYDSQMITHLTSITTLLKNSKCMLKLIVHFLLGHFPSKILL